MVKSVSRKESDSTNTEKKVKSVKGGERTHYDVFSRSRGYMCSCPNEAAVHEALEALFRENEKFWRRARSEGKKGKTFDCFGVARTGHTERVIELTFRDDSDEEFYYEDVKEQA